MSGDANKKPDKLNMDAQRAGNYADDKRADIRVSFGGATRWQETP